MKSLLLAPLLALALPLSAADDAGWLNLFDGKSLDGWKVGNRPGTFHVENGEIVVHGETAHLFYDGPVQNHDFTNFELKADVLTKPGSNSGIYFHTLYQEKGWPDAGFEVQVNNTHKDPKKTAGLYDVVDNYEQPVPDDTWFTMDIRVEGKHVVTKVNGKVIVDYTEPEGYVPTPQHKGRKIAHGTFALQGHDPGSEVHFKNIMVKPLP